ncbi:MAG: TolC family protein, partial [Thermoanaerobaculia bacterium]
MKRLAIAAAIALWAGAASAQTKLTLHEALTRALEVNDTVEISRAEIGFAEATKSGLLSAVMPRITVNGALTRNSIEQKFGEGDDGFTILPRNDWNYALILTQPVYAGGRELRAYSQAKLGVENAKESAASAEDGVLLRVASSYLAVVNADRRIEVEHGNIELAERRLTQARAFYEAG